MKFIVHNLRMIRARLRSNGWVFAELFLVFIVMWFLCDSLGCLKYTFYRPLGYNIDHVYQLSMIKGGESRDSSMTNADKYLGILQKLEREPAVEVAALSYWSLPMSGNNSYNSLAVQDTIGCELRIINATGGYTRVFRMKEDAKRSFAAMPVGNDVTSGNYVMLSEGAADYYKERVPGFSLDTPLSWYGDSANVVIQCGMIGSFRSYRYGADAEWAFRRIDENVIRTELRDDGAQIVFRVKENMDSPDYRSKFLKEIAPHLDTDNMFIADVVPYTEQQYQFEVMKGDVDKVNTQTVVVVFLLVNVFLGLIGTFWFRTRRRRNEIALRLAMGSTKKQIFCLLMGEGLLLLTLVTLPAMIVCYNVGIAEFTMGHTELITTWPVKWSFLRFLLGSLGAWLLIALMVVIAIETIIETKFDLTLEYHCLRKNGSILGETIFDEGAAILYDQDEKRYRLIAVKAGTILVEERLCVDRLLGRLRFTCAHELGHWVLHQKLYSGTGDVAAYEGKTSLDESHGLVEWQADALATALLMPLPQIKRSFYRLRAGRSNEQLVAEMAQIFQVSKQAMRIRLETRNLI